MIKVKSLKTTEYYQVYLANAIKDNKIYSDRRIELNAKIKELKPELEKRFDVYKDKFNIVLNQTQEWVAGVYIDNKNNLFTKVRKIFTNLDINDENREDIIILMDFASTIKEKMEVIKLLKITEKRKNIKFREFSDMLKKYYYKVHEVVLNGDAYQYQYGIGSLIVETWKNQGKGKVTDFHETWKNKQRLIAEGKIPYDEEDAKKYEELGIPYMGVKYSVERSDFTYNKVRIINSRIIQFADIRFKAANTMPREYKPFSYESIAKEVNSPKDIAYLPIGLALKVALLDYKYPNYHIKFIRNAEGSRFKHRTNNSKT